MIKNKCDAVTYRSYAKDSRVRFLILHFTSRDFATSARLLTGPDVSCHYLVPDFRKNDPSYSKDELIIYNMVDESERAWHAGVSFWNNRVNLNDSSIGIEIVNLSEDNNFIAYPDEQIDLVIELCQDILSRNPYITPVNVLGHSDIAIGRKKDPGPLFPWYKLYQAGIGAWFDEKLTEEYTEKFTANMPSAEEVVNKLSQYGYNRNVDQKELFSAFQMHFRPENYDGDLDPQTAAIAYALCDKYVKL